MRFVFEKGKIQRNEVFYTSNNGSRMNLRMRDVEYHNSSLYAISNRRGAVKLTPS